MNVHIGHLHNHSAFEAMFQDWRSMLPPPLHRKRREENTQYSPHRLYVRVETTLTLKCKVHCAFQPSIT